MDKHIREDRVNLSVALHCLNSIVPVKGFIDKKLLMAIRVQLTEWEIKLFDKIINDGKDE